MKKQLLQGFVLATAVLFLGAAAGVAAAVPDAKQEKSELDLKKVRSQLSSYFKNIERNSPTVLGALAKSPETMQAIEQRIASMSEAELAGFQKLMSETPDWKIAPEGFASGLPPEMLDQVRRVGADYAARVPKGEKMRDDVRTLVSVLKLLPDAKLKELGVDRKMIESLEATFSKMSPLQAAMLHRQVTENSSWREKSAMALGALPPALQRGAAALAEHGPLTEKDVAELNSFRGELIGILKRIEKLPPETRKTLKAEGLTEQAKELSAAPPDVLFMVRHNMPAEMLKELRANVAFLERISNFNDKEKEELEQFRSDFTHAFDALKSSGSAEGAKSVDEMVAGLTPQQLFMLQKHMASFGVWQVALPVIYQTLASPETPVRLQAVKGPTPDPMAVQSLEAFRQQALVYIDAAAATPGIDAKLVERARRTIQTAPLDRLELIRMSAERLPPGSSAEARLTIAVMHEINFGCSLSVTVTPEICFPEVCVPEICVGGECETILGVEICNPIPRTCTPAFCTPAGCTPAVVVTADFNAVCNPIEDALEVVEHSITTAANAVVATMQTAIQASIDGVNSTINAAVTAVNSAVASVTNIVNTSVSAITSVVNSISSFAQTIPNLVLTALTSALNLLLDFEIRNGVTVRNLVGQGAEAALNSMKTLLGLTEGWWTALSNFTLPAIPCPPAGFHTPWGNVGDGAAADNFARYQLMIAGILGMIPDTEISLAIKIPAQVLYLGYEFLGVCLEQEAAAAADANAAAAKVAVDNLATARHSFLLAYFPNLQTFIGGQIAGFASAAGSQTTTLINLINSESTNIQNSTTSHSSSIQTLINNENDAIQNLINLKSTEIQNALQNSSDGTQANLEAFKKLDVRLVIERVLQAGTGGEVGHLLLRAPWGHLALVADIVRETIDAMTQAHEGVGLASTFYDKGVALMNAGKDKEAFRQFSLAYQETTRQSIKQ